jgi:hypothetical protein
MSAFVVSKAHIDFLIRAGLELDTRHRLSWFDSVAKPVWVPGGENPDYLERMGAARRELRPDTADQVGRMIWAENHRSVSYRYDEAQVCPDYSFVFHLRPRRLDPVQVLKALRCYEYQSCECPDWERTEAHDFCESLRLLAVSALPGYEDAEWEIEDPEGVPT